MATDFQSMAAAAQLVGLSVYAKAALQLAVEGDPAVVSLRIAVAFDNDGSYLSEVTGEYLDESGQAVGGFSL